VVNFFASQESQLCRLLQCDRDVNNRDHILEHRVTTWRPECLCQSLVPVQDAKKQSEAANDKAVNRPSPLGSHSSPAVTVRDI
jgi:hypothetical protein